MSASDVGHGGDRECSRGEAEASVRGERSRDSRMRPVERKFRSVAASSRARGAGAALSLVSLGRSRHSYGIVRRFVGCSTLPCCPSSNHVSGPHVFEQGVVGNDLSCVSGRHRRITGVLNRPHIPARTWVQDPSIVVECEGDRDADGGEDAVGAAVIAADPRHLALARPEQIIRQKSRERAFGPHLDRMKRSRA